MNLLRRIYRLNLEQTINLLSEFGPLITLFVVNAAFGVTAGIWSLVATTILALIAMRLVLNRLPVFALIAGGFTLIFSSISLWTKDPVWVQIKVTLFNLAFALFLTAGLVMKRNFFKYTFGKTFHYSTEGWNKLARGFIALFLGLAIANEVVRLGFWHSDKFNVFGWESDGLGIWVMFKVAVVMPLSGIYAVFMTRLLRQYAIAPEPVPLAEPVLVRQD